MTITAPPLASTGAALDIGVQRLVGLVEVCLDGSLDQHTIDALCDVLRPLLASGAAVDLDCTELVAIDGFGLALLLDVHHQLREAGGSLVVRYAQPVVLERLCAAALDDILTLAA